MYILPILYIVKRYGALSYKIAVTYLWIYAIYQSERNAVSKYVAACYLFYHVFTCEFY